GKKVDKAVQDTMTDKMEKLDDLQRHLSGQQTVQEQELAALDKREDAWLRALQRGDIQLQEGATVQDLLDMVRQQHDQGKVADLNNLGDMANVVSKTEPSGAGDPSEISKNSEPVIESPENSGLTDSLSGELPASDTDLTTATEGPPLDHGSEAEYPTSASTSDQQQDIDNPLADFPTDPGDAASFTGELTPQEENLADTFMGSGPTVHLPPDPSEMLSEETPEDAPPIDIVAENQRERAERHAEDQLLAQAKRERIQSEQERWQETRDQMEQDREIQESASQKKVHQAQKQGEILIEAAENQGATIMSGQELEQTRQEIITKTEKEKQQIEEQRNREIFDSVNQSGAKSGEGNLSGSTSEDSGLGIPIGGSESEKNTQPSQGPNGDGGMVVASIPPGGTPNSPQGNTSDPTKEIPAKCKSLVAKVERHGKTASQWNNAMRNAKSKDAQKRLATQGQQLAREGMNIFDEAQRTGCAPQLSGEAQRVLQEAKNRLGKTQTSPPPKPSTPRSSSSGPGGRYVCSGNATPTCHDSLLGQYYCYCPDGKDAIWVRD
ncbi:MAG: hypothetical protein OEW33_12465, partial [Nitrospirota bacterium]|nr:hypothetical protein [Nitrospirota bacterium]